VISGTAAEAADRCRRIKTKSQGDGTAPIHPVRRLRIESAAMRR
jgi:hypothetical protein